MLLTLGIFVGVIIIMGLLFVNLSPQFGGKHTDEAIARFETSQNFKKGKFTNQSFTPTFPGFSDLGKVFKAVTKKVPNTIPSSPIKVEKVSNQEFTKPSNETKFIWFGHSAFLLEIQGKRILIDPMLSDVPAPHPWLGGKRFTDGLPMSVEDLPSIDAVIFSHDHYDHLDYETIQKIKKRVKKYFTPLGLGTHLQAWGIDKDDIVELDWWEETQFEDLKFVATPARHFSGRGLSDSMKTLWASWIIQSETENIYFSGDSGYDTHFKKIGEKYGPFDIAFMECGQYNDDLPDSPIHMYPEQTAQAALDVKAQYTMPIHWASFKLNNHPWKEPVERLIKKAEEFNITLLTPRIGQVFTLNSLDNSSSNWWEKY
ncbi:membrane protein [Tenacibaculum holothuriorum]|uniref:Membrane protein n=2 Tax=Tenacibaculum holothuriorum TaxID=1635173 RepID=A0A1Y2PIG3_9FLAO|nr:membrane protein [Tenacibaculum holothuriorum]